MNTKYFIGVGGTGARIAEALLHVCAAGLGPDQLGIILIDPDDSNGNLDRTRRLLTGYLDARTRMKGFGGASRFFHTEIVTPTEPEDVVWRIFADRNVTLSSRINYDNLKSAGSPMANLMEVLFSEQELKTSLNEGFRGHPSIGAVIMSNMDESTDPWKWILERLANAPARPQEFDIFLAGSVFGGTGAAGVPTFGAPKMLKQRDGALIGRESPARSKVRLGGALVLPYFSFGLEGTRELEAKGQMFKRPDDFPLATRVALEYYAAKYDAVKQDGSRSLGFDEVFLLGDSLLQSVGTFGEGSTRQNNRPHYIELAGAFAALDFFREGDGTAKRETSFFTAGRTTAAVDWSSLPVSRRASQAKMMQGDVQLRMAAFATFAYALHTEGLPVLATRAKDRMESWYLKSFSKSAEQGDADPSATANRKSIEAVAEFGLTFLHWIANLDDPQSRVELFDRTRIFEYADNVAGAIIPAQRNTISSLVKSATPGALSKKGQFVDALTRTSPFATEAAAAGRFLHLFAASALTFCEGNYALNLTNREG